MSAVRFRPEPPFLCPAGALPFPPRGVAQPGRAPALGAGCRRFESCRPEFRGLFEFWLVERTKGEYKGCAHVLCIWVEYRQKEKEAGWQGWLHECPALRIRRTVAIRVSCLHSCTQTPHNASMRAISNSYPPLPLRYKVLARTLYTTPPPEPDTHIIPGRRKKNPGSSGRGAIMFTLADTS